MRRKNWRLAGAGLALVMLAALFFLFFFSIASRSTDPVALMRIVGQASGVVGGVGTAMVIAGLIGRKVP